MVDVLDFAALNNPYPTASKTNTTANDWGYFGLGAQGIGTLMGAMGALQTGSATAAADKYNAAIATLNSGIAKQNATWAANAGDVQAGISSEAGRVNLGSMKANMGASGVDINSGSHVDVLASQAAKNQFDAMTIRSNAARAAYGYEVQSVSDTAQAHFDIR